MAEQLQQFLDKIQSEGVAKAEAEAKAILDGARAEAKTIIEDARTQAGQQQADAEREAGAFQQRAEQAVRQASRDVLLNTEQAIAETIQRLLAGKIAGTIKATFLKNLISEVVTGYAKAEPGQNDIALLVSPDQVKALTAFARKELAAAAKSDEGVEVKSDDSLTAGFRVSMAGGRIEHDFSSAAVTDALCQLLRPQLAALLRPEPDEAETTPAEPEQETPESPESPAVEEQPGDDA